MASSGNYSLLAVPAHFGIAMMVHLLKQGMIVAAGMRVNNVDPRTNVDRAAKKMTPAQHRRLARVTAAHNNLLEGLPLFAAGIIMANMVGLPIDTINYYAAMNLILRVIYVFLYVGNEKSEVVGLLRTIVWGGATYASVILQIKAGMKVYYAN